MLYRPRTAQMAQTPQTGMFALCAEKKKNNLNRSKSTCCTFCQVVGQKLDRTGSCHHRFQVKTLFISTSVLIFFSFFAKSSLFCQRSGSVDRYQCLPVGNNVPGKQLTSRGFQSPQIRLLCSQLAPLFQVTNSWRKPRWPETGRSIQRVRQNLLKHSPCTSSSSPVLNNQAAFHPCFRQAWESASLAVKPGLGGCEQLFSVLEYHIVCQNT